MEFITRDRYGDKAEISATSPSVVGKGRVYLTVVENEGEDASIADLSLKPSQARHLATQLLVAANYAAGVEAHK